MLYNITFLLYNIKALERYRSGHNGTDSKSVEPQGSVGSNPTRSANVGSIRTRVQYFRFFYPVSTKEFIVIYILYKIAKAQTLVVRIIMKNNKLSLSD